MASYPLSEKRTANEIIRGGIYYISKSVQSEGAEMHSGRPGIVVSDVTSTRYNSIVLIVYLTSNTERLNQRTHVPISSSGRAAVALCEQVTTVDVSKLGTFLGVATPEEMTLIKQGLAAVFGMQLRSHMPISPDTEAAKQIEQLQAQVFALTRELATQTATAAVAKDMYRQLLERVLPAAVDTGGYVHPTRRKEFLDQTDVNTPTHKEVKSPCGAI